MVSFRSTSSSSPVRLAAVLIAVGAACLGVKAIAILVTGDQPPILFEVAGLPLGVGLVFLGRWSISQHGSARRLTVAVALSGVAALASAYGALMLILSQPIADPLESLLAISGGFFPIIAALLIGLRLRVLVGDVRVIGRRALLIAIAFVPLMILGGISAGVAGERYLELGLLLVAITWLSLAAAMWAARTNATSDVMIPMDHGLA